MTSMYVRSSWLSQKPLSEADWVHDFPMVAHRWPAAFLGHRARRCQGDDFQRRPIKGPVDEEALTIFAQFEDADEVDEACEGAWVVAGFGGDLLEAVAHGVGVDVHLLGGSGDVEVGVGERPDGF